VWQVDSQDGSAYDVMIRPFWQTDDFIHKYDYTLDQESGKD